MESIRLNLNFKKIKAWSEDVSVKEKRELFCSYRGTETELIS